MSSLMSIADACFAADIERPTPPVRRQALSTGSSSRCRPTSSPRFERSASDRLSSVFALTTRQAGTGSYLAALAAQRLLQFFDRGLTNNFKRWFENGAQE
jgi:hypothetical protein